MTAPQPRHLDTDAVMLWRSLADIGPATVLQLVEHWAPTYTAGQVLDMLKRLQANGLASSEGLLWQVADAEGLAALLLEDAPRRAA